MLTSPSRQTHLQPRRRRRTMRRFIRTARDCRCASSRKHSPSTTSCSSLPTRTCYRARSISRQTSRAVSASTCRSCPRPWTRSRKRGSRSRLPRKAGSGSSTKQQAADQAREVGARQENESASSRIRHDRTDATIREVIVCRGPRASRLAGQSDGNRSRIGASRNRFRSNSTCGVQVSRHARRCAVAGRTAARAVCSSAPPSHREGAVTPGGRLTRSDYSTGIQKPRFPRACRTTRRLRWLAPRSAARRTSSSGRSPHEVGKRVSICVSGDTSQRTTSKGFEPDRDVGQIKSNTQRR